MYVSYTSLPECGANESLEISVKKLVIVGIPMRTVEIYAEKSVEISVVKSVEISMKIYTEISVYIYFDIFRWRYRHLTME